MEQPSQELLKMMESPEKATPEPTEDVSMTETETIMSGDETAPMAAPMSTPEPKMGSRESALINVGMAMDLLEQSLASLGVDSDEGTKVLKALNSLTNVIGQRKSNINELQQSEIAQMLQSLPQAGGATPESKALAAAPQIPGMGGPAGLPAAPGAI